MKEHLVILGGGLAGLYAAKQFAKRNCTVTILEKEREVGGLCRSFVFDKGIVCDIGPHIFFSRNKDTLAKLLEFMPDNTKHRRSNRIIHDHKLFQYPFENSLSLLNDDEKHWVSDSFINNQYENLEVNNMLQFFLKIFGDGITKLYLEPYNEKIWKHHPAFLDTQMVERIPRPPVQDILNSLHGKDSDGYLHQLFFHYPNEGGASTLINNIKQSLPSNVSIITDSNIKEIRDIEGAYQVVTRNHHYSATRILSTIPLRTFCDLYVGFINYIELATQSKLLKHNDIYEVVVTCNGDIGGDNFAFMNADRDVIFHRVSKINFLKGNYDLQGKTTLLAEVTVPMGIEYEHDWLKAQIKKGLDKCFGHVTVDSMLARKFENAYVIYDLNHYQTTTDILTKFRKSGHIQFAGRQGLHQYLNTDQVIESVDKVYDTWNWS
jgi:protoporphyrinogen oxidase